MFGDEKSSDHCLDWNHNFLFLCLATYTIWCLASLGSSLIGILVKRIGKVPSVVCLFVLCADSIKLEEAKYLFMVFGISKLWKYGITFKFMLSDTVILDLGRGLICLPQEELFTKLLFSKKTLRNFINPCLFQVIGKHYGKNKKYYPMGKLTMCLLIHLGRTFQVSLPQNYIDWPAPTKFCP